MTPREYKTSLQYNANTKQDYCIDFYRKKKVVSGLINQHNLYFWKANTNAFHKMTTEKKNNVKFVQQSTLVERTCYHLAHSLLHYT